jgi:hypothetical protein
VITPTPGWSQSEVENLSEAAAKSTGRVGSGAEMNKAEKTPKMEK